MQTHSTTPRGAKRNGAGAFKGSWPLVPGNLAEAAIHLCDHLQRPMDLAKPFKGKVVRFAVRGG